MRHPVKNIWKTFKTFLADSPAECENACVSVGCLSLNSIFIRTVEWTNGQKEKRTNEQILKQTW